MKNAVTCAVKLVIWDLDETFWEGTLSEGGGVAIEANIACVRQLVDRGIMNAISSKNDHDAAMARLAEMGIADMFVFPRINWEDKGPQIAALIADCRLRPQNVLFVDDNPHNLQEAAFSSPGLMTAGPEVLPRLLDLPGAQGRPDPGHERLKQFKVLERKSSAQKKYSSNEEFLRHSDIRVCLGSDCVAHADRIAELIERTNQLNFTKKRIARKELDDLLADATVRNLYVSAKDAFGDYGIVGFVSIRDGECLHFLFSCRIIGLGVVEWVYDELGQPRLDVVGETVLTLPFQCRPDWINQPLDYREKSRVKAKRVRVSVLLRGGCDLSQMEQYLRFRRLDCEFNHRRFHRDHTAFALSAYRFKGNPILDEIRRKTPFLWENAFETDVFGASHDVVVFSLLIDYIQAVFRYNSNPDLRVAYGVWMRPVSKENLGPFKAEELNWFLENFTGTGRIGAEELKADLRFIRSHMPPDVHLVLINGCEVQHENPQEQGTLAAHRELNKAVDAFLAECPENTHLLDMRRIVTRREQLTNCIRHYQRDVYWEMAQELMRIVSEIAEKRARGTPSFLKRIATAWKTLFGGGATT